MTIYYNKTTNKYYNSYDASVADTKKEMELAWLKSQQVTDKVLTMCGLS